jgi:hypothetical protein
MYTLSKYQGIWHKSTTINFQQPDEGKEVSGIQIGVPTFTVFYIEMAHTFLIGYVGLQTILFKFLEN